MSKTEVVNSFPINSVRNIYDTIIIISPTVNLMANKMSIVAVSFPFLMQVE